VAYGQQQLWSGAGAAALSYLHAGGLADETICHFGWGWNPRDLWDDARRWGLDGARIFLSRGVLIPCEVGGNLWYVKSRRFDAEGHATAKAGEKYSAPRGGRGALFGADHLVGHGRPLLLCEGERDAMLAMQELSHLVDVATLGGAGRRNLGHWALWLLPYRLILAAYDADAAGQEGAAYLAGLSERVRVVQVPHGHDLTGFHADGGDLRAWLLEQWKRVQMVTPERRSTEDEAQANVKGPASCPAVAEARTS
jgi:DNA primase